MLDDGDIFDFCDRELALRQIYGLRAGGVALANGATVLDTQHN